MTRGRRHIEVHAFGMICVFTAGYGRFMGVELAHHDGPYKKGKGPQQPPPVPRKRGTFLWRGKERSP